MRFLKRPEILLLLFLAVTGGGWLALYQYPQRFRGEGDADAPFRVTRVELKRDYANAILTLRIDYDNREGNTDITTAAKVGDPDGARLVTESGRAPQLFFLPGVYPPVVKAGERKEVEVIYWLESAHLREALYFVSGQNRITVKSAGAFQLENVENRQSIVFTDVYWNIP